jgi:hypothetical protein
MAISAAKRRKVIQERNLDTCDTIGEQDSDPKSRGQGREHGHTPRLLREIEIQLQESRERLIQ